MTPPTKINRPINLKDGLAKCLGEIAFSWNKVCEFLERTEIGQYGGEVTIHIILGSQLKTVALGFGNFYSSCNENPL